MDVLYVHITPSNTHLSDGDIKVEDLNLKKTSKATFENVGKTEACCSSTQDIVKVENLKEIHGVIPDGSFKIKEKIKPEHSSQTFMQSNFNMKDILKTESPCDTQIPYTVKLEKVMKYENLRSTHLQYSETNVKLEVNIEGDNSPKNQTTFNDIKVKVEENMPAESLHDAHVDVKCENDMETEAAPSLISQFVKLEENYTTSCDDSIPPTGSGPQVTTAYPESGQASPNLNEDSQEQSSMRTQVSNLLEKTGYASRATESTVKQIMEMLANGTLLQTEEQLADLLGVEHSTQATGDHIVNGRDDSLNEEPRIEVDVNEVSESYWEFPTSSDNSIQEKEPASSIIDLECQNIFNEKFVSREDTNTHSKKAGGKGFECSTCGKVFSNRWNLQNHNSIHSGEKPYQCEFCCKRFSQKSHMEVHKRTHSGEKPYQCEFCCKRFSQKSHMEIHKRIHTGERPYQCEICYGRFAQKSYMEIHKRTHSGEKPYQCEMCGKRFSQKSHMEIHKKIHTGEKPYQCEICCKRFSRKRCIKRHKRIHSREKV